MNIATSARVTFGQMIPKAALSLKFYLYFTADRNTRMTVPLSTAFDADAKRQAERADLMHD